MINKHDLGDGVVQLDWAMDGPVNCMNRHSISEFAALVDAALADEAARGIVVTSSKPDFIVGADLDEAREAKTPADFIALVTPVLACLRKLETGGKPVVAVLAGQALGGGFEVALACHHRVATEAAKVGFPEVTLSLIPGAGGTQRLVRMIGIAAAAPLLLEGKVLDAAQAKGLGLIDEVLPQDELIAAAKTWIINNPKPMQPWDKLDFKLPGFHPQSNEGRQFFAIGWSRLRGRTFGNDRAAETILQVLHHGAERQIDAAIKVETRHFGAVASQAAFKNRLRTQFFGVRDARAMKRRPAAPPSKPSAIGVIGGGLMGGGIAYVSAQAGLAVTLIEASQEKAEASKEAIAKIAEREASRGRLREPAADLVARITPTTDYGHLAKADLVIEAVFERKDVKKGVLEQACAALPAGVPLASNTSSIPIGELAVFTDRPAEFVGMHFFSPVERMPLVELIRAKGTSDATVARALDYLKAIRKTPVVVHDGLGFFTSRVVSAYSFEALTLLAEGVAPALIDNAALLFGMPIGPMALADSIGLPLLVDVAASMKGDGNRTGMKGIRAAEALDKLVGQLGRKGKAGGAGVFDYPAEGKTAWDGLAAIFPPPAAQPSVEEVQRRLMDSMSLEAVRTLEDGVLDAPIDGDVAAHLGLGYPAQKGGPFAHIDDVGLAVFAARCDEMAERVGGRFEVPGLLRQMAASGRRFHDL